MLPHCPSPSLPSLAKTFFHHRIDDVSSDVKGCLCFPGKCVRGAKNTWREGVCRRKKRKERKKCMEISALGHSSRRLSRASITQTHGPIAVAPHLESARTHARAARRGPSSSCQGPLAGAGSSSFLSPRFPPSPVRKGRRFEFLLHVLDVFYSPSLLLSGCSALPALPASFSPIPSSPLLASPLSPPPNRPPSIDRKPTHPGSPPHRTSCELLPAPHSFSI